MHKDRHGSLHVFEVSLRAGMCEVHVYGHICTFEAGASLAGAPLPCQRSRMAQLVFSTTYTHNFVVSLATTLTFVNSFVTLL